MKYQINEETFKNKEENFWIEYYELLINRLTHSSMSLESDLGDIDEHYNAIKLRDNMRAFNVLNSLEKDYLTEEDIKNIASIVNASAIYISDDYRKIGNKLADTSIAISNPDNIHDNILNLLNNYYKVWTNLDSIEREARFHIEFIKIHPFEDGNGRTARLLLNYNLLKQGIAPIIITNDLKEYYHEYIRNNDIDAMSKLFKIQSMKEKELLDYLWMEYKNTHLLENSMEVNKK